MRAAHGDDQLIVVTFDTDGAIATTSSHPFWRVSTASWTSAAGLRPGDSIQTPDGGKASITTISGYAEQTTVYNLTVDNLHTYYVLAGNAWLLVHNSACNTLTSSIHDDPLLAKAAEKAGKDQTVQRDLDAMQARLAAGNMNPEIGNGYLSGTDVSYGRTKGGARLFFRNTPNGIQIVGKSSKANEDAVIARLKKLYAK